MAQDRGWKKGNGSAGQSLRIRTKVAIRVARIEGVDGVRWLTIEPAHQEGSRDMRGTEQGGEEGERGAGGRLMTGESRVATEVHIHAP